MFRKSKEEEGSHELLSSIIYRGCVDRSTVVCLFVLTVQTDRCAWWTKRRRRNEEGAWHTHDTLAATHRALCTGIHREADERDPPRLGRVSQTRYTRFDTQENGWKSRADLRQLLVRKVQYVYIYIYNYTLFPHFLSILRLISFFNYFYSMMELLLLLHLRAPSSHIHERINIYNEYNEFVRSKNKRRVFHKAILLSRILFNTVYIPNRIVFLT